MKSKEQHNTLRHKAFPSTKAATALLAAAPNNPQQHQPLQPPTGHMPPPDTAISCVADEDGVYHLLFPADHPAIAATRGFLGWSPGEDASQQCRLPVHLAIMQFLLKCNLSNDPSHAAGFGGINILTFNLTEEAWSRVLNVLTTAGVFAQPDLPRRQFNELLLQSSAPQDDLIITPTDIAPGAPFDAPAGGARGRGRGGRSADPPDEDAPPRRDEELRFLALCPVLTLVADRGPPLNLICKLAGVLGPCLDRRQRLDETSSLHVAAKILVANIHPFLGAGGAQGHAVIAAGLKAFLAASLLPTTLQSNDTTGPSLIIELSDGIRCVHPPPRSPSPCKGGQKRGPSIPT